MATDDTETPFVTTENPPLPSLDPPLAPFATSDTAPHSSRSSFTRVDQDDDQRREHPLSSDDPIIPPTSPPVPHDSTNTPADESEQLPLLASAPLQEQESKTTQFEPTATEEPVPQTPQTHLTFLLISGKRRTMAFEPGTAIGRVKELAWNSWPLGMWTFGYILAFQPLSHRHSLVDMIDWQDERPPAPSYLRVLYLGRMLQDDETLTSEFLLL